MATTTNQKRPHDNSDSDNDQGPSNDYWPHFIILTGTDDATPIGKLSPFAIDKGIQGIAGTVNDIKRVRN